MSSKYRIIAIYGPSGAGKNRILQDFLDYSSVFHKVIPCTTRPPREDELNDKDYHFITVEEFIDKISNNFIMEATIFNNWIYGTSIDELDINKINVGIFNLQSIRILQETDSCCVIPFLVQTSDKKRLQRCLAREENPDCHEICRRFLADQKDFQENHITDAIIYDNNQDVGEVSYALDKTIIQKLMDKFNKIS